MSVAHGWAIYDQGEIIVQTVSPHPRGAKVNWLWVVARVRVMDAWSDAEIEVFWLRHSGTARCVPVTIRLEAQ